MCASANREQENVQDWVGREMWQHDILHAQPARFMQATLDRDPSFEDGDCLPPLWHWLYFLEARRTGELGRDAHPKKGSFLPPVSLPRRMWAGGRFTFHAPLILGKKASKRSVISAINPKVGRSGRLCFVTVLHEIRQDGKLMLVEEQDIVYREDPDPQDAGPTPKPAPDTAEFSYEIEPSEVMLFRYSALTFNGHRIHYDADYAREVEGYDGLVFHGPLTATFLIDLACSVMTSAPTVYSYRGVSPLTGLVPFTVEGRRDGETLALWAKHRDGALAMTATAGF